MSQKKADLWVHHYNNPFTLHVRFSNYFYKKIWLSAALTDSEQLRYSDFRKISEPFPSLPPSRPSVSKLVVTAGRAVRKCVTEPQTAEVLCSSTGRASPPHSLLLFPLGPSELRVRTDKSAGRAACTYDDTEVLMSVSVCCFCLLFTRCVVSLVQRDKKRKNCSNQKKKNLLAAWWSQNFQSDGLLIESSGDRTLPKVYQQHTAAQLHHNLQWEPLLEPAAAHLHN